MAIHGTWEGTDGDVRRSRTQRAFLKINLSFLPLSTDSCITAGGNLSRVKGLYND